MVVNRQRQLSLQGVLLVIFLVIAGCGGHVDGCLAPGPCAGDFPANNIPAATVEPSQLTVAVGSNATFVVQAPGLTTPTYQWYRSNQGGTLQQIPGATGDTYTLVGVQRADDGTTFEASVDGGYGSGRVIQYSSVATLTVQ